MTSLFTACLALALLLAPGCAAPVGEAVAGESATRAAETRLVGELAVTVVAATRTDGGARAAFAVENRGATAAVLSPGNYRLRTDGPRPRMQLKDSPTSLPVGTVQPGQSLRGEVTWELSDGSAVAVVFVNGADTAEWMLSQ
jgi:hypothetical protein